MNSFVHKNVLILLLVSLPWLLIGCGVSGSGGGSSNNKSSLEKTYSYTVGGTVTGLIGNVVLQDNGADDLEVTADGPFVFNTPVANGQSYHVTVLTQPAGQLCTVGSQAGNISGFNIDTVIVTCADTHAVGGTVTGLIGNVVLQDNGADDLEVTADGPFVFNTPVADGQGYSASVLTQPAGLACAIENATGTVSGADVDNIIVTCSTAATFIFTADVTYVNDPANVLGGAYHVNDQLTGQYTYGLDTVDSNASSSIGDYWHYAQPFGIEVDAGGTYFKTDPNSVKFLVELANDSYTGDSFLLRSDTNTTNLSGFVNKISWQLDDASGTALDSIALTVTPPVLSNWDSYFGLSITGCPAPDAGGLCPFNDTFEIKALVTSVTLK